MLHSHMTTTSLTDTLTMEEVALVVFSCIILPTWILQVEGDSVYDEPAISFDCEVRRVII